MAIPFPGRALLILTMLVWNSNSRAAVSLTSAAPVVESFSGFLGSSTPANWQVSGNGIRATAWNGSNESGGFQSGWYGNQNMGALGGTSAFNLNATWELQNNTGTTITGLSISCFARLYQAGTASPSVTASFQSAAAQGNPPAGGLTNPLGALTFNDTTFGINAGTTLTQTANNLSIPQGHFIYIRFLHAGGFGSDLLTWDEIRLTPELGTTEYTVTPLNISLNNIDLADPTGAREVTAILSATNTVAINSALRTGSAEWSLVDPPLPRTIQAGNNQVFTFRYSPAANDGLSDIATFSLHTPAGNPVSTAVTLTGKTVKNSTLAQARGEVQSGAAGSLTTIYKFNGYVSADNLVNGIVNSRNQLYMQDRIDGNMQTRGLMIDDPLATGRGGGSLPAVGTALTVYGTISPVNGALELLPTRSYLAGNFNTLVPVIVSVGSLSDSLEGVLITLVATSNNGGLSVAGGPYIASLGDVTITNVTDGVASDVVTLRRMTGIEWSPGSPPGMLWHITGVVSQSDPANPIVGGIGYFIQPRVENDLIGMAVPVELSEFNAE